MKSHKIIKVSTVTTDMNNPDMLKAQNVFIL